MAKLLVVCFSRGGTTLRVGRDLMDMLGADLEEIRESSSRRGALGYSRSLLESVAKGLPSIQTQRDPRDYDLTVVGTPVWAGSMSSPVRSYLFLNRHRLPRVAFFATMGGRGAETVLEEMKLFCTAENAPTFFATEREVHANAHRPSLDRFASELRALSPTPRAVSKPGLA